MPIKKGASAVDHLKGVIFNLLEDAVSAEIGDDGWDRILAAAATDGAYTSLGTYDDAEFMRLVAAAGDELDMDEDDLIIWFGRDALGRLAISYPDFFSEHRSVMTFLPTLTEIHESEVRKLYPGAITPVFTLRSFDADHVVMSYRSDRGLCAFGTGLIEGAAEHFGERVSVEQVSCRKRNDDDCVYDVRMLR